MLHRAHSLNRLIALECRLRPCDSYRWTSSYSRNLMSKNNIDSNTSIIISDKEILRSKVVQRFNEIAVVRNGSIDRIAIRNFTELVGIVGSCLKRLEIGNVLRYSKQLRHSIDEKNVFMDDIRFLTVQDLRRVMQPTKRSADWMTSCLLDFFQNPVRSKDIPPELLVTTAITSGNSSSTIFPIYIPRPPVIMASDQRFESSKDVSIYVAEALLGTIKFRKTSEFIETLGGSLRMDFFSPSKEKLNIPPNANANGTLQVTMEDINEAVELVDKLAVSVPVDVLAVVGDLIVQYSREEIAEEIFTKKVLRAMGPCNSQFISFLNYFGLKLGPHLSGLFFSGCRWRDQQMGNIREELSLLMPYVDIVQSVEFKTFNSPVGNTRGKYCQKVHAKCLATDIGEAKIDPDNPAFAPSKVFMVDIPCKITEPIIVNALRNCGAVSKVWLFSDLGTLVPLSTNKVVKKGESAPSKVHSPSLADEDQQLFNTFANNNNDDDGGDEVDNDEEGIYDDDRYALEDTMRERESILESVLAFKGKQIKKASNNVMTTFPVQGKVLNLRPSVRSIKVVTRVLKDDERWFYAFIAMKDISGHQMLSTPDVRCFGICIQKVNCRVKDASTMTTLIVEDLYGNSSLENLEYLSTFLVPDFKLELQFPNQDKLRPAFIHLEFECHNHAWLAYQKLSQGVSPKGKPLRVFWVKSAEYKKITLGSLEWKGLGVMDQTWDIYEN